MKKYLVIISLALALAIPSEGMAQKHRHTPVATMQAADSLSQDEVEAFSDTTSTDSTFSVTTTTTTTTRSFQLDDDVDIDVSLLKQIVSDPSMQHSLLDVVLVMGIVLFVLFVLPLLVLALLIYFIYKNRRQKVRLAEEAVRNGHPIPDQLFNEPKGQPASIDDLRTRGIRQTCLGLGLMVALGYTLGSVGFGVGALVTAIGVGNLVIAHSQRNNL